MSSSQDGTTDADYDAYLKKVEKDSSTPPPPPSDSNSSTPSESSSSSPPPPSSESPPPPDSSSPPPDSSSSPPPDSSSSPPPPSDNNNNDGSSNSSPPPPPDSDSSSSDKSPPPPPKSSSDNSNSSPPPPPPPSSGSSSSWKAPPPPPPPPPPPAISGSSTHSSVTLSSKTALIAGASVGGGLLLLLVIVCLMACCRKKKRNKEHGQMDFFTDNPHSNEIGGNGYYNSSGNWPNKDHAVKVPLPPSQYSSGAWSGAAPPPPPPGMNSSEIASFGGASLPPPQPSLALGFNQSTFSYDDLAAATSGFTKENLLGQGGFGYVHKGVLPTGKEIAVKSLKSGSGQGEREFQAEVDIISRVHHKHLVSLVGYCIADAQRMLVYEFVPNSSLEHHLYGKDQPVMDFPTRLKIALGSAKGFAYLHEDCHPRIIHRDIKAANILLDNNYEAKVADFGLAKLSNDNHTHVSTRIMGTFGYLAPEYASSGKLTEKSDVYSFGVVLLELITGKRPVDLSGDDDSLVDWARPILVQVTEGGSYEKLVDPRLGDSYNHQEMLCIVACAAACIRHSARRRPRMSQVVRALEGDANLEDLNDGVRPGHSAMFGSSGSSDYDSYGTGNRRVKPRGNAIMSSNEFTSSEHTGEYNIHASPSSSADSHESHRRMP